MSQIRDRMVMAEAMVRSRAWREGFESFRLGDQPEYLDRGRQSLAYEYGRLTAAYLAGRGERLPRIPTGRRPCDHVVTRLARTLQAYAALENRAE